MSRAIFVIATLIFLNGCQCSNPISQFITQDTPTPSDNPTMSENLGKQEEDERASFNIHPKGVGPVRLGMPLKNAAQLLFGSDPIYLIRLTELEGQPALCGQNNEGPTLCLIPSRFVDSSHQSESDPSQPVDLSTSPDDVILNEVIVRSPQYTTDQGVHPGMSIEMAEQIYGASKLNVNPEGMYLTFEKHPKVEDCYLGFFIAGSAARILRSEDFDPEKDLVPSEMTLSDFNRQVDITSILVTCAEENN